MTETATKSPSQRQRIAFALAKTSLGLVLVAGDDAGICAIFLGEAPEPLLQALRERFSRAELINGSEEFLRSVTAVTRFIEQPRLAFDFPLNVQGTPFQRLVWTALCEIPSGRTASYAEIARKIGRPRAVRAVAGACAANKIAVVIPCHRVVRSDGDISGYRWGVERKRELLKREAKSAVVKAAKLIGASLRTEPALPA
jgi:AraC family transcriptional regulator of adaptative response/methylated-DNA-[protein]-cysteine methyltransferase